MQTTATTLLDVVEELVLRTNPGHMMRPISGDYPSEWTGFEVRCQRGAALPADRSDLVRVWTNDTEIRLSVQTWNGIEKASARYSGMPAALIHATVAAYLG